MKGGGAAGRKEVLVYLERSACPSHIHVLFDPGAFISTQRIGRGLAAGGGYTVKKQELLRRSLTGDGGNGRVS